MALFIPLPRALYEPSARVVAPQLLGHWLIRNTLVGPCGGAIVETEAYLSNDPACHGFPGLTPRNRVMFGAPGHGYVYLIYGFHFCVNAVCRPSGVAEAVLIRAVEPAFGEQSLRKQRQVSDRRDLTNGPAKLCQAMAIDRGLDGIDLCDPHSALFIAQNARVEDFPQRTRPGHYDAAHWHHPGAALPLRFFLAGSPYVSQRRGGQTSRLPRVLHPRKRFA